MALYETSPAGSAGTKLARPVDLICFALIVAQVVYLAACYVEGSWLTMRDGGGVPSDFVNVWAAGRMALAGHAASVYDWPAHKLVEESLSGMASTAISAGIIRQPSCSSPPRCRSFPTPPRG